MSNEGHRWVISGGIGSGKSAVRGILAEYGFQTIDADAIGHQVLRRDGPAFQEVSARWPHVVRSGEIDRSDLGRIVFADQDALRELEGITHPHIFGTIRKLVQEIVGPVCVEVPLIRHALGDSWTRLIVDCSDDVRFERLIERGVEASDVRSRMASQPTRGGWLACADIVVPNHGDRQTLRSTVGGLPGLL